MIYPHTCSGGVVVTGVSLALLVQGLKKTHLCNSCELPVATDPLARLGDLCLLKVGKPRAGKNFLFVFPDLNCSVQGVGPMGQHWANGEVSHCQVVQSHLVPKLWVFPL